MYVCMYLLVGSPWAGPSVRIPLTPFRPTNAQWSSWHELLVGVDSEPPWSRWRCHDTRRKLSPEWWSRDHPCCHPGTGQSGPGQSALAWLAWDDRQRGKLTGSDHAVMVNVCLGSHTWKTTKTHWLSLCSSKICKSTKFTQTFKSRNLQNSPLNKNAH